MPGPSLNAQVKGTGKAYTVVAGADSGWSRNQVDRLYGWDNPGCDYETATETSVPWPNA